jgi:hypothetical protein
MDRARIVSLCVLVVCTSWASFALGATGTTSTLYITSYGEFAGGTSGGLDLVQGLTVNSFPTGNQVDICIAAAGDIKTMGYTTGDIGSRFNLAGGTLVGGPYVNNIVNSQLHDGTSDGVFNYSIDYPTGNVLRFTNNWTSPSVVFNVGPTTAGWITMNASDGSFWLSQYGISGIVEHRSGTGTLLGAFNSGLAGSQGLALDPIDGTLWLGQGFTLYQFTQTGLPLQNVTYSLPNGQWFGMEFDTTPVLEPEPSGLWLLVMGIPLLLVRRVKRCASLVAVVLMGALMVEAQAVPVPITPGPALNPGTNLFVNGSFEGGFTASPSIGSYWAAGTAGTPLEPVTGWITNGSSGNYAYRANTGITSNSAPVPDGAVALYFGNGFISSISETPTFNANGSVTFVSPTPTVTPGVGLIPPVSIKQKVLGLTIGNTYALSFWASGEDAMGGNYGHDGLFGLDVTGFTTAYLAAPSGAAGGVGNQKVYRFQFVPTTSTVTFEFTNWGHISGGGSSPLGPTPGWTIPLDTTELVLDHAILNDLGPGEITPEPGMIGLVSVAAVGMLRRGKR